MQIKLSIDFELPNIEISDDELRQNLYEDVIQGLKSYHFGVITSFIGMKDNPNVVGVKQAIDHHKQWIETLKKANWEFKRS